MSSLVTSNEKCKKMSSIVNSLRLSHLLTDSENGNQHQLDT